ncbi:MAG TPA: DNA gyrase inhibitor YacG [Acidobacteriaceae bacterium]|nr:DNA gyrase inhibitor YacG [Acidobacteriaceae bacterium]
MSPRTILRCPTCNTLVTKDDEDFPFCSDRCRLIDLGRWASGEYRISSPILDPEVLEGLSEEQRRPRDDDDDSGSR